MTKIICVPGDKLSPQQISFYFKDAIIVNSSDIVVINESSIISNNIEIRFDLLIIGDVINIPIPTVNNVIMIENQLVKFIISHYNEDLSYIIEDAIIDDYVVYTKCGNIANTLIPKVGLDVRELKNVGRESHTYLTYIIDEHDNLPEVIVFLQGSITDHNVCTDIKKYVLDGLLYGQLFPHIGTLRKWGRIHHKGRWLDQLNSGEMERAEMTMGEFWSFLFKQERPKYLPITFEGCFSIRRTKIDSNVMFYERIIKLISNHSNPEYGHYFERFWWAIFNPLYDKSY